MGSLGKSLTTTFKTILEAQLEMSYRRESDEAMRPALDCGVAINAAYRFLTHHERQPNGF